MKPRELLLQRHAAAEEKLDNICRKVIQAQAPERAGEGAGDAVLLSRWDNLIRPLRWHVGALSAAWVVVVLLNLSSSSPPTQASASASRPEVLVAVQENRRHLLQMLEPPAAPSTAVPWHPRRRSALACTQAPV